MSITMAAERSLLTTGYRLPSTASLRVRHQLQPAEAPVAALEVEDGFEHLGAAEVGPERLGHVNLAVGGLPEQEVRDAQLAARPHQEVEFGQPRRVEVTRDVLLGHPLGRAPFGGERARGGAD